MTVEVIIALMDKWEADMMRAMRLNQANIPELLNHYVRLKISWGRLKRYLEYRYDVASYSHNVCNYKEFEEKQQHYANLITEARRNYYVAKRRYESEHTPDCSCRGCRCIKGITGCSQDQSQSGSC